VSAARSDRKLLLVTGLGVVLAGALFAGVILLATGNGGPTPDSRKPLFLGLEPAKKSQIRSGGPQYTANPFGDPAFWLDLRGGHLVAYSVILPDTKHCIVKWKAQQDAYVDQCTKSTVAVDEMNQYLVTIGPRDGSPKDSVYVDLHTVIPATS
jgi:hypothetical protein